MSTPTLPALYAEHRKLLAQARLILDAAANEQRDLTEEETNRYDDLLAQADKLSDRIQRHQALAAREAAQEQPIRPGIKPTPTPDPTIGMSRTEIRRYSIVRAIHALATGNWRDAQLEYEASQAVAQRLGYEPQGIFVPYDWLNANAGEQRQMTVGTPTAGGHLVSTDLLVEDFITLLRNRAVVITAGARTLTGLVGDVAIPRQTGGATAYWIAETGAPTASTPSVDQVSLTPHTVGAYTDISRKLLKQSSLDVEQFVRADLAATLALAIDAAALHGSGTGAQPTGLAASGINTATAGPANWARIVELETLVAADNADLGALAYMMNATERGKLKTTPKETGMPIYLWENGDAPVNGYPAYVSNQVAANRIFFGNWSDLIIGMWGVLDLMVDPYTNSASGAVRVIALQDVDIAVRHPESFSVLNTSP